MYILSFVYTKENGDVSERDFIPLVTPEAKKNYFGIDITELNYEDQVFFRKEIQDIEDRKQEAIKEVMQKYDIGHAFRTFSPEKMSKIVMET
jgi:hypothetical protein